MTLSVVSNLAIGDVITEAWVDAVRENSNDYKTFAEGTAPFVGGTQKFCNDANLLFALSGSDPYLQYDAGDYLLHDRTANELGWHIGGVKKFAIDSSGRIQTAAFTSTEQTITAGSTATIAHGLGVRPRWWGAVYGTTTGTANCTRLVVPSFNSLGGFVRVSEVDATNITIINGTAVTVYVYAGALK